jgi:hypothetical protein
MDLIDSNAPQPGVADELDRLHDLVAFLRALAPSVPVGEAFRQWDEQQEVEA